MKKVLVGMSGGIDSSVAAYLLGKEGYEVEGATMLIWRKDAFPALDAGPNSCYSPDKEKDIEETKRICALIGIPHHTLDLRDEYEKSVLSDFRSEYLSGRTPSPCLWCNTLIKFGAMVESARKVFDFDYFATGHYARITEEKDGRYVLRKALDSKKDQSYFLSRLTQSQLSSTLFPLGEMRKDDVRKIDVALGFHGEGMAESQDFIGGDYSGILGVDDRKGRIILEGSGLTLGWHRGYWHYTVGQRKGLGVSYPEPLYVIYTDPEKNEVHVGTGDKLEQHVVRCSRPVWGGLDVEEGKVYSAKIRSASPGVPCTLEGSDDGFTLSFLSPVRAATAGQSAVVYDGDAVVASGVIESAE